MATAVKKRTIYRDHKNGRFAKKSTWKRSVARGSKRYTRERVALPERHHIELPVPEPPEEEPEEPEVEPIERELKFGYGGKRNKSNSFEGTMFLGPDGSITKFIWNTRTYTAPKDIELLEGVLKASESDPRGETNE